MKFTTEQIQQLKNCHPEADEKRLLQELEMKYRRGISFEYLLQNLPEALEKRKNMPWMVAQRRRLFELSQVIGDIPELKDNNFRSMADDLMRDEKLSVEQVATVIKLELEGKKRELPVRGPVVATIEKE